MCVMLWVATYNSYILKNGCGDVATFTLSDCDQPCASQLMVFTVFVFGGGGGGLHVGGYLRGVMFYFYVCHACTLYSVIDHFLHGHNYDDHYHDNGKEDTDHDDGDERGTDHSSTSPIVRTGGHC